MELTGQERQLLIECVECTDARQSRQLTDKLETLLPNRNWAYIWDPVGKITFPAAVLRALGPPYDTLKAAPESAFAFTEPPHQAPRLDTSGVQTRPQNATQTRQTARLPRWEEIPRAVRDAAVARAYAAAGEALEPAAEPEPPWPPKGFVELADGTLCPVEAFRC